MPGDRAAETRISEIRAVEELERLLEPMPAPVTSPPSGAAAMAAARRTVLAGGRTTIRAGTTKRLVVKLGAKALRRLKRARTLRVTVTIRATGPTGLKATLRRRVKLRSNRRPCRAAPPRSQFV